jgi:hypothetical protein
MLTEVIIGTVDIGGTIDTLELESLTTEVIITSTVVLAVLDGMTTEVLVSTNEILGIEVELLVIFCIKLDVIVGEGGRTDDVLKLGSMELV